jgi:hypothetical protein
VNLFSYKTFSENKSSRQNLIQAIDQALTDEIDIYNFSLGNVDFNDDVIIKKVTLILLSKNS